MAEQGLPGAVLSHGEMYGFSLCCQREMVGLGIGPASKHFHPSPLAVALGSPEQKIYAILR